MSSRPLRHLVLAVLVAGTVGSACAAGNIYTCTDAKGRRLTSDRPIPECNDREQRELNASGTVRRTIPPTLTPVERAAEEARLKKVAEEQQRQAEEKRMQKLLVARYPNQRVHDAERAKAVQAVEDAAASARRRIGELQEERAKVQAEAEFYKNPAQRPPKLQRQFEEIDQQVAAQQRFIAGQEQEKARISKRYDDELARLKLLWTQQAAAAAPLAR